MPYNPGQPRDPKGSPTGGQWSGGFWEQTYADADPIQNIHSELSVQGMTALYRGTGAAGLQQVQATPGGVYGPGVYFYTEPGPSRSHATWPGGGVLVAYAPTEAVEIFGNVAVVRDASAVTVHARVPLADTTRTGPDWLRRIAEAWNERPLPGH